MGDKNHRKLDEQIRLCMRGTGEVTNQRVAAKLCCAAIVAVH
jgi:hypothetical protein